MGKIYSGKRSPGNSCVIIDEVDSMVLDKGENMLYLSHNVAGMETLEPIYVWIWNLVNSEAIPDSENIHKALMRLLFYTMSKEDLSQGVENLLQRPDIDAIWNHLVGKEIIDQQTGEILVSKHDLENLWENMGDLTDDVKGALLMIMRHELHSEKLIDTSNYLRPYIRLHLTDWIESAIRARYMLEGDNYVIDINRTEANQAGNVNIVIMDTDTGTEQYNSQWSNGLHQFFTDETWLSYHLRNSESGVHVEHHFFSNNTRVGYMGLLVPLVQLAREKLLQDLYDIEFFNIPTFRPTQFTEEPAIVCNTEEQWRRTVVSHVRKVAQNRPVLVICDTVRNVEKLAKYFSDVRSLHVYTHSYQELNFWKTDEKDVLDEACIILATNLAGRGTDIKIHKRLETLGRFTCMPDISTQELSRGNASIWKSSTKR